MFNGIQAMAAIFRKPRKRYFATLHTMPAFLIFFWIVVSAGCSSEDPPDHATMVNAPASSDPASSDQVTVASAVDSVQVFPEHLTNGFDHQITVPITEGGYASAGIICRGHGADVLYVSVKDAVSLADGIHTMAVDKLNSPLRFETGAPDAAVGAGAAQMAFDESEYVLTFEGIDVEIMLTGCGSR